MISTLQTNYRFKLAGGIPDRGFVFAQIGPEGTPTIALPNQLQLPAEFLQGQGDRLQRMWFPSTPLLPPSANDVIINLCTDAWTYRKSLNSMQKWLSWRAVVLNHPAAVARIHDSAFLQGLARIPNLRIPRRVSFVPTTPDDFGKAMRRSGLNYPVRLHEAADRQNTGGLILRSVRGFGKALEYNWPHRQFVLTEVDPQTLAMHTRWRISFVGRAAEVISLDFSYSRGNAARETVTLPASFKEVSAALLSMVPLDHWTAELALNADGKMVLLHLWAGLPEDDTTNTYLQSKLAPKYVALLCRPDQWRMAAAKTNGKRATL
ncbi:MAG: hypothetical protein ACJAVT_001401 [Yoonia sp.]|jgi:hypothetical protein